MRIVQCAALFLPLFLCADSPNASLFKHKVQIQLHNSKTTTANLNPLALTSGGDLPRLLPYGFVINTNRVKSEKIIVKKQKIDIPKNAKALLLTFSKSKGKEFCQEIKLTPLAMQLSKFKDLELKEYHVPIYLQLVETAVHDEQSHEQKTSQQKGKEETPIDHQSPAVTKFSKKEFNRTALNTIKQLFNNGISERWPIVKIGFVEATDAKNGIVYDIECLAQTVNKSLDNTYFSLPYNPNDINLTYIKIQHKVINLTKKVKDVKLMENPHIIIEIEIVRKRRDGSIIFPHAPHYKIRNPTSEERENLPEIREHFYRIYFQFNKLKDHSSSEEEEFGERSAKSRRQRHIGPSS